ncbi:serine hydrolase domain-containing protein [Anaeromicropila herbilytica]|uniref:Serine hydrolase n=1 Tax=Anaeromicropila herbilytica TaxID=2785025 RepID=A0A7R7EM29_9FIRM|nr:serine hydrolase domain-containing protein [Anaeromicropila herbilytica]BCN31391.1 serine hydrolase [Anaeromicropila herbilytica]
MKKCGQRVIALLLMMVLCMSSAFTVNVMGASVRKESKGTNIGVVTDTTSEKSIKTSGQVDVPYPDKLPKTKDSKKVVKSFSASDYADTKEVADSVASYLTSAYGESSVQYALIDNGKIVLSGNAKNSEVIDNTAIKNDSIYGIGSVSKMFTTAAVMNLVEDGKVNLDSPVTDYIKDFTMKDERYKKITVRMLINHSSGIMGTSSRNALLFNDNDTFYHDHLLKELKTQRLKADPGAYSVYCNDGFSLAEILVERVTGVSFTTYITNTFINPLVLNSTATPVSKFDHTRLAKLYSMEDGSVLPQEMANIIGTGGIFSSAEDLCIFARTFMKDSNGILNSSSLNAMMNNEYQNGIWPDDTDNSIGYGLGWDCVNTYPFNQYNIKALSKGGDTLYYHSNLTVLPEQNMAIAIVSSGGASSYNGVAAQKILLTALKEKGVINEIKPEKTFSEPVKVALTSDMKKYEGTYLASDGFLNIKMQDEGVLDITYPQHKEYGVLSFVYVGNGKFALPDGSGTFSFTEESNGVTYLRNSGYNNITYLGQSAVDLYIAQKIELNNISDSVAKVWDNRIEKEYYLLNEKYSSASYAAGSPNMKLDNSAIYEGYLGLDKIIDENNAIAVLNGPGSMSRDIMDYTFFKKGNVEYLSMDGYLLVEGKSIKNISSKSFTTKINKDGYAVWYKIPKKLNGKKITVKVPKNAAFVVYDSEGTLVNDSYMSKIYTVTLPKNGEIAFLGNANSKFTVKYK